MVPIRHHSLSLSLPEQTILHRVTAHPHTTVHRNMSCDLFYHFGEYKGHLPLSTGWKLTKSQGIKEDKKKKIATLLNVTNEGDILVHTWNRINWTDQNFFFPKVLKKSCLFMKLKIQRKKQISKCKISLNKFRIISDQKNNKYINNGIKNVIYQNIIYFQRI